MQFADFTTHKKLKLSSDSRKERISHREHKFAHAAVLHADVQTARTNAQTESCH
jgi:hypothetical protein